MRTSNIAFVASIACNFTFFASIAWTCACDKNTNRHDCPTVWKESWNLSGGTEIKADVFLHDMNGFFFSFFSHKKDEKRDSFMTGRHDVSFPSAGVAVAIALIWLLHLHPPCPRRLTSTPSSSITTAIECRRHHCGCRQTPMPSPCQQLIPGAFRRAHTACSKISDVRHYSLTCCEAACIIVLQLKPIWIWSDDEILNRHVLYGVLSGCLMCTRYMLAWFWHPGWCWMTIST